MDECSICLENLTCKVTATLDCKHIFHTSCILPWLLNQQSCPLCRVDPFRRENQKNRREPWEQPQMEQLEQRAEELQIQNDQYRIQLQRRIGITEQLRQWVDEIQRQNTQYRIQLQRRIGITERLEQRMEEVQRQNDQYQRQQRRLLGTIELLKCQTQQQPQPENEKLNHHQKLNKYMREKKKIQSHIIGQLNQRGGYQNDEEYRTIMSLSNDE